MASARFKLVKGFVTLPILLALAGCGQGWEVKAYHGTPYDGDRMAGSGVEYVRAHMAPPASDIKAEAGTKASDEAAPPAAAKGKDTAPPAAAPPAKPAVSAAPVTKGEAVFKNKTEK